MVFCKLHRGMKRLLQEFASHIHGKHSTARSGRSLVISPSRCADYPTRRYSNNTAMTRKAREKPWSPALLRLAAVAATVMAVPHNPVNGIIFDPPDGNDGLRGV